MHMDILQQIEQNNERVTALDHHDEKNSNKQPTYHIDIAVSGFPLLLLGRSDTWSDGDSSRNRHSWQSYPW